MAAGIATGGASASNWDARADALALLGRMHTCTLATVDAAGRPHACNLLFAHDGFSLLWFSDPASRHSRHIDAAPAVPVMITVAADHADFTDITGLQMSGTAQRLADPQAAAAAVARLAARYPFLDQAYAAGGRLAAAMAKAGLYRFDATSVTLIDNRRGFGSKASFDPDAA